MSKLVVESIENSAGNNPLATLMTEQATTSGTSIDFTSIPSGVNKIDVILSGVSIDAATQIMVQLGDSGGIETSGYTAAANNGANNSDIWTTGFGVTTNLSTTAHTFSSILHLIHSGSNKWVGSFSTARTDSGDAMMGGGSKTLSGELDRIRLTSESGSANFDAGSVNVRYEY